KVKGGIARKGLVLGKNGENIGNVTSCTWSPYLKCGVGIIRVKNIHFQPGLEINVEGVDGKLHNAILSHIPMYDQDGLIVRGKDKDIPTRVKPAFPD
ncbi:MAG: glycine cleavage T C-terminal barrel domain-containing protein, partial [Pseudomonadota bacterium]|nr:glycine cleavage T C-terminal barrel domain-containing protein [Pseudomonadota bacterium]